MELPLPGFGRTLSAAGLSALAVSLLIGTVVVTHFKDESLEMLLTIALFGLPYALLVAVIGPRLTRNIRTIFGRLALWSGPGFICGASILALPSALLGKWVNIDVVIMFGGCGALGSMVLMAMLGRR